MFLYFFFIDCQKFYMCDGSTPIQIDCMAGLKYDVSLFSCSPLPVNCPN